MRKLFLVSAFFIIAFVLGTSLSAQTKTNALVYPSAVQYETSDTGAQITELFLTIETDKIQNIYLGTYPGYGSEDIRDGAPKNAKFGLAFYWAGAGTNLAFVVQGQKIVVYSQIADEEFIGDFKAVQTVNIPVSSFEVIKSIQIANYDIGKVLSIKNKANFDFTVVLVQSILTSQGYTETGKIDGYFGANTEKALKHFQKDNKLPQDGIVNQKTWDAFPLFLE